MTLQTTILSIEMSDFLKQIMFLKSFNFVLDWKKVVWFLVGVMLKVSYRKMTEKPYICKTGLYIFIYIF